MSPSAFSTPIRPIPPFKRDSASPSSSLSNEKQLEREAAEKAAGYFASSMFQNSPSPEELPDPLLFWGFYLFCHSIIREKILEVALLFLFSGYSHLIFYIFAD